MLLIAEIHAALLARADRIALELAIPVDEVIGFALGEVADNIQAGTARSAAETGADLAVFCESVRWQRERTG